MNLSLTPAFRAIAEAASTSQSAPRTMSPRPTSSKMIVIADSEFDDTDYVCLDQKKDRLNQQLTERMDVSVCGQYPGRKLFQARLE